MIDIAAQDAPTRGWGRSRTWLQHVRPANIEHDDWVTYVNWNADADGAIAKLRAADPSVDALLRIAEGQGLAMVPVWVHENGPPHPLAELAYTAENADWIMVAATAVHVSTFTAEMLVDPLAPTSYSLHTTPSWTIYVTAH